MKYLTIKYEKRGPVSLITLDRPREENRINLSMAYEIDRAIGKVLDDEEARVVVLTGAGNVFCAGSGVDVDTLAEEGRPLDTMRGTVDVARVASAVGGIEMPVIGSINGDALGQGLELALACDIRLASQSASFGLDQIWSGLIPWDGGTQRLPRLIGRGRALSMILLGETLDSREALRIGLVHRLFSEDTLLQEAMALAEKMATYAPIALRYAKEAVNKGMDMTLNQGLRLEQDLTVILQTTEDRAEGIRSFLEKRKPRFEGK